MSQGVTSFLDPGSAPRGEGRIARAVAWLLQRSSADRCLLLALLLVVFTSWPTYWAWRFYADPEAASFVNDRWAYPATIYLGVCLASFGAVALAALVCRRTAPEARWLQYAVSVSWAVFCGLGTYFIGTLTLNMFAASGITATVLGMLLLDRRPVLFGLMLFLGIVVGAEALHVLGVLSYAPFLSHVPVRDGGIDPLFVASYAGVHFVLTIVAMLLTFFIIAEWRGQQRHHQWLQEVASAAREERLSWFEHLAGFLRHELKNQLVALDTSLRLLRSRPTSDADTYFARAHSSVDVMRELIGRATEASDLESALRADKLEPLDLSVLVRERLSAFADTCRDRRLEIDVTPRQDVTGNEIRLIQVLDKLLANALEHSREGDEIRVGLWPTGDVEQIRVGLWPRSKAVVLRVENDGDPLPDDPQRLFEPFVSHGKGAGKVESLGLGLYVVRSIVEQHGGRVVGRTRPQGTGARFDVILPRRTPQSSTQR